MKVIDLLNKIANGEEIPKEMCIQGDLFLKRDGKTYYDILKFLCDFAIKLNDEVEIIEEEKKIPEKLNTWYGMELVNLDSPTIFTDNSKYINFNTEMFFDKINEIIDYLKSKGDE